MCSCCVVLVKASVLELCSVVVGGIVSVFLGASSFPGRGSRLFWGRGGNPAAAAAAVAGAASAVAASAASWVPAAAAATTAAGQLLLV